MPTRVLAIDDDPAMTDLLNLLLRAQGFDVITANNGEDGVRYIQERSPDLVMLDLMMKGMDGWAFCTEVRKFSRIPILVLSALDKPANVASALDAGADDYLIKPVPSGVLVAHINTLTRRNGMNKHKKSIPQALTYQI